MIKIIDNLEQIFIIKLSKRQRKCLELEEVFK